MADRRNGNNERVVLAVDDEPAMLRLIKLELTLQGYRVFTAGNAEEALRIVEERRPDLLLLDLMLPDISGIELMKQVRERTSVPVIILTAKDADIDKVRGLQQGADDYVVKPFSAEELSARIDAVLRRTVVPGSAGQVLRVGDVEIDLHRRVVTKGGEELSLTRTEWMLLEHLAVSPGRTVLNTELLGKVWGPEYRQELQYLRVWVSRLRRKLEDNPSEPQIIKTKPGLGYMLEAEATPLAPTAP